MISESNKCIRLTCHKYREATTKENARKETSSREKTKRQEPPQFVVYPNTKDSHQHLSNNHSRNPSRQILNTVRVRQIINRQINLERISRPRSNLNRNKRVHSVLNRRS